MPAFPTTAAQTTAPQEPYTLIVQDKTEKSALSGSTLTLLVFVTAVVVLILVIVLVLVLITRRTEFNSKVQDRTTLPAADKPVNVYRYMNDDIPEDGTDYSDINPLDGEKKK